MESPITSPVLKYTSQAWPARLAGVSIFVSALFVFFFFPNVPLFIPIISFVVMLLAVFFAAEISVTADRSLRALTIIKKRIIGSTNITYSFDDIVYFNQNITTSIGEKGERNNKSTYSIALNTQPGSTFYERGRIPNPITIPTSTFAILNKTVRDAQEFTRARALADFIGVPLYVKGGPNDSLANAVETIPGYIEGIQKIPDVFAQAKKENDRVAREILGDKHTG